LPDIERTQSGIRRYTDRDLEWLGLICCLKNTGMSLQQIKIFVDLSKRGDKTLKQRCDLLADHRIKVEAHMEETRRHLEKVSHKLAYFTAQYEKSLNEREIKNIKKSEV
jgi:DNA-binding transcriptional MerR regulator